MTTPEVVVAPGGPQVVVAPGGPEGLAAAGLWVDVGAAAEAADEAGACHFLEHAVFRGSARHPGEKLRMAIGQLSGDTTNAFTTHDATCLYTQTLTEDLPAAIELLTEVAFNPELTDDQLARERDIVLAEIASTADRPAQAVRDLVVRAAWGERRHAGGVTASTDDVRRLTPEQIRLFHRRHFVPGNAVLSLAGDIDPPGAAAQTATRTRSSEGSVPLTVTDRWWSRSSPTRQAHLCFALSAPGAGSDNENWLDLAISILSGGQSSLLHEALQVAESLAYQVSAAAIRTRAGSLLLIYVVTSPDTLTRATAAVAGALARLPEVPDAHLDRIVRNQIFAARKAGVDPLRQMMRLGRRALGLGRGGTAAETEQWLTSRSPSELRAGLAATFGGPATGCAAVIGPGHPAGFSPEPEGP